MKQLRFFIILFITLISLPAHAENVINWYHADFPPSSIMSGNLKGTGHENLLEKKLQKALPEYKHFDHTANYGRILKQLKITNGCCVTMMKTPDREKYIEFSEPIMLYLSNGVITLKSQLSYFKPYIDAHGFISINRLFHNSTMRMGISKGRRYGGKVDSIIDSNTYSKKLVIHYKEDLLESLLKNIQAKRSIDYAIGYPHELQWLISQNAVEGKFIFIPIREMPEYNLSYMGCSKNKWGKRIISKVNKIIKGRYEGKYKKSYQKYLPADLVGLHEKCVSKAFSTHSN
ncbi:TIGR02285 family protein [Desulfovibrio sp. JC022]|uniref:TIGR02285 family protein n=1 Tax=Desulfovibrio sp. JC022 TaxID=2593642 RepID=UPI0013D3A486|nr:TIGR02285 family protein [Desulfovibrio sp. JC022]NDV21702.1 TIGR02285 family protein [Desulfovibrio sp. JC022]